MTKYFKGKKGEVHMKTVLGLVVAFLTLTGGMFHSTQGPSNSNIKEVQASQTDKIIDKSFSYKNMIELGQSMVMKKTNFFKLDNEEDFSIWLEDTFINPSDYKEKYTEMLKYNAYSNIEVKISDEEVDLLEDDKVKYKARVVRIGNYKENDVKHTGTWEVEFVLQDENGTYKILSENITMYD